MGYLLSAFIHFAEMFLLVLKNLISCFFLDSEKDSKFIKIYWLVDLGSEEAAGLLVAEVSETVSTFIFKAFKMSSLLA